jgi:hypothetical protein
VPYGIADAILGQLLEVRAFAALLKGLDTDFGEPSIAGEPGTPRDVSEVRLDAPPFRRPELAQQVQ